MKIFNIFKNSKLVANNNDKALLPSELVSTKPVQFSSNNIEKLDIDGFIDTTDELTLAKYKNNLKLLAEEALNKGYVDKFFLIRNDNYFPTNFEWSVASSNSNIELLGSTFTYELRRAYAKKLANISSNPLGLELPSKKVDEIMASFDYDFAKIYGPVAFRSTKHFTINTPLGYTHDYNFVSSNRLFTVIDNIDNFVNSGYAYTLSYRDSYLDVSHKPLPISQDAIVMISKDNYDKLSSNSEFQDNLNKFDNRRLIIFNGDESIAINMVLSSIGVLPSKVEHTSLGYDRQLTSIIEDSLIRYANSKSIDYNISHGNLNGKGGHYSDYLDEINQSKYNRYSDFINFLKYKTNGEYEIDDLIMTNSSVASRFIENIGVEKILSFVDEFNTYFKQEIKDRFNRYITDRHNITPEIDDLFKNTLKIIDYYFKNKDNINIDAFSKNEIELLFSDFYYVDNLEGQVNIATNICKRFNVDINDFHLNINNL